MLTPLGLDEDSLAVYQLLLEEHNIEPDDVAERLGKDVGFVTANLDKLRELGLLVSTWSEPGAEHAVHPRIGLAMLAQQKRANIDKMLIELRDAELEADTLAEQYTQHLMDNPGADIEVFDDDQKAERRIEELLASAKESAWMMSPVNSGEQLPPIEQSSVVPALNNGAKVRLIYPELMPTSKLGSERLAELHERGADIRTAPLVPDTLVVIDEELVVIPRDPNRSEPGAAVHRSPGVVALATALFDIYWTLGANIFEAEQRARESPLTPQEQALVWMLAGGAKDEQVARHLGISLRTVRRTTAILSDRVGASSRFELGVEAARHGWV